MRDAFRRFSAGRDSFPRNMFLFSTGLIALMLTLLLSYVPLALDDLWFLKGVSGEPGWHKFAGACGVLAERLYTDTGRLGNLISPLFLALFPKIIFNILSGLFFFLFVEGLRRLAQVRAGGLWSWLILLFCTLGLPWYDFLVIVTYSLNYLWAGTAAVWAACFLLRPPSDKRRYIPALAVCFIAGWMHEGFGIPLSAASLVLWFTRHGSRRMRYLSMAAMAGTLMTALSPAIWLRLGYQSFGKDYPFTEALVHFGPLFILLALFLLMLLLSRMGRLRRDGTPLPTFRVLFFLVYVVVATAIALKFYCGPRTTMSPLLFAFAGTVAIGASLPAPRVPRALRWTAVSLLMALLVAHMSAAIARQKVLKEEFDRIVRMFGTSPDGVIYADLLPAGIDLSLYKTTARQFHEVTPRHLFSSYYNHGDGRLLMLLPSRLKDFVPCGKDACASMPGVYISQGLIVALPGLIEDGATVELTDAAGHARMSRVRVQTFRGADGHAYDYVVPHLRSFDPGFDIRDVRYDPRL